VEDQVGKTLLVDDFATMRKIVKNALRQIDITDVAEAESKSKPSVLPNTGKIGRGWQ